MATGFYDANGIWNYGESDNIAPFSDTLNKLADSTSDAFTADRARIGTLEAGSLAGLIPVVPASIVVASGTAAVNDLGVVSFSNASAISLNGAFSANYRNYCTVINQDSASIAQAVQVRLRAAGVDAAGAATYYRGGLRSDTSGVLGFSGGSGTSFQIYEASTTYGLYASVVNIFSPFTSGKTNFVTHSSGLTGSNYAYYASGGTYTTGTSFDGLSLLTSTGTFTGSIQVFAYND